MRDYFDEAGKLSRLAMDIGRSGLTAEKQP